MGGDVKLRGKGRWIGRRDTYGGFEEDLWLFIQGESMIPNIGLYYRRLL